MRRNLARVLTTIMTLGIMGMIFLFSMEPAEFAEMARNIRDVEKAMGTVKYGPSEREMANYRFRRSIFCVEDMKAGDIFTRDNVRVIRPGDGLEPKYYDEIMGMRATVPIKRGTPLRLGMVGIVTG